MIFYCHLRFLSEKFQFIVEKVSAGSPKLHFSCLFELCEQKISVSVGKLFHFFAFFGHWAIVLLLYFKLLSRGCRKGVLRVQKNILRKICSGKEFFSLSVSDIHRKVVSLLARFIWAGLSQLHSACLLKPCKQKYTFLEKK